MQRKEKDHILLEVVMLSDDVGRREADQAFEEKVAAIEPMPRSTSHTSAGCSPATNITLANLPAIELS